MIRSFHHSDYPLERLLAEKRESVTVVLPAREVADTIGCAVDELLALEGFVDQVLVVDAGSEDGTAEIAAERGAEVHQEAELVPAEGPVLGKGDAMWRALSAVRGELVAYVDSDTRDFPRHFATGLLGPLVCEDGVEFVKGRYRRDAGRVTELTARPLLAAFYPALVDLAQPLAGEIAARRETLASLPFATGYGVEIAMVLDVAARLSPDALAQSDLEERIQPHQALADLAPMARTVLAVVLERLRREGRLPDAEGPPYDVIERPPYASVRASA